MFSFCLLGLSLAFPTLSFSQETVDDKPVSLKVLDYPSSLAELLKNVEGKLVYIDLMASWCKPCIMELKASQQLQPYFEANGIVELFISIDNQEDIGKAISMIQKNALRGYFVSYHSPHVSNVNSTFAGEIESLFLKDENGNYSISIPKYAIVNKKGEIVERRAERPSNATALKKQLEKYAE